MDRTTLLQRKSISVSDFRCTAVPGRRSRSWSSTACPHRFLCAQRQLRLPQPWALLRAGGGIDPGRPIPATNMSAPTTTSAATSACRSFLGPETGGKRSAIRAEGLADRPARPPLPELMVLGELAQAAADGPQRCRPRRGRTGVRQAVSSRWFPGRPHKPVATACARSPPGGGKTALWIDAHSHQQIDPGAGPPVRPGHQPVPFSCGCSRACWGLPRHQYLVRSRLASCGRALLADNDISITDVAYDVGFGRPLQFRAHVSTAPPGSRRAGFSARGSRGMRKIFQERPHPATD